MDASTIESLAELICGDDKERYPIYRSGSELTRFFQRVGFSNIIHDGSSRKWWVLETLKLLSLHNLQAVVLRLADPKEYRGDREQITKAIRSLNEILSVEGLSVELAGPIPKIKEGSPINFNIKEIKEKAFKPLPSPNFHALKVESRLSDILAERWNEVQRCVDGEAYLASTILMGSLLEGILLSVICRYPQEANLSPMSPKDPKTGDILKFHNWTLAQMIDVAHNLKWIDLDVKKFSHSLRDFRNFIHPHQQLLQESFPDKDTSTISWYVVQAAITDLTQQLK